MTTTQRALKRLADAGLLARFQLHRDDGGGTPQCVALTPDAIVALGVERAAGTGARRSSARAAARRRPHHRLAARARGARRRRHRRGPRPRESRARAAPRSGTAGARSRRRRPPARLPHHRGGRRSCPRRAIRAAASAGGRRVLGGHRPARLLGRARRPRDARARRTICSPDGGARSTATGAAGARRPSWWCATRAARSLEVAVLADGLLSAALARIGRAPGRWERPGRAGVRFAAEGDLHRGDLGAWAVPPLPPALRDGAPPAPSRVEIVPLGPRVARTGLQPPWR